MKNEINKNNLTVILSKKEVEDMIIEYLKKTKGLDIQNKKFSVMPQLSNINEDRFSDTPVKFNHITVNVEDF